MLGIRTLISLLILGEGKQKGSTMAITSSDHTGTVIGHTAKIFAERREDPSKHRRPQHHDPMARLRTHVLESCLAAYVQVWVNDKLVFVQCPLDVACVPLYNQRTPTLAEIQEVLRLAQGTYPVGSELTLTRKETTPHNGRATEMYSVKRDRRALVNIDPSKRNRKEPHPAAAPVAMQGTPETEAEVSGGEEETPAS